MRAENGFVPYCMRPSGCEIEDIAADVELNEAISTYLAARAVYEVAEMPEHLQTALRDLDLNDPGTILELENIYARHRQKRAEEEARKRKIQT